MWRRIKSTFALSAFFLLAGESIFPRALSAQGNLETLARSATMNANGEAAKAVPELLSPQNARLLLDSTEAFLFDCDGCSWFLFQFNSIRFELFYLFVYLFIFAVLDG